MSLFWASPLFFVQRVVINLEKEIVSPVGSHSGNAFSVC